MSILSDLTIRERIKYDEIIIDPLTYNDIQPCSVDLHLASDLINLDGVKFDLKQKHYNLQPNEFILGSTNEWIEIPNDLSAQVDGKSSIGRCGIDIHKTAGWIDAGFKGNITLEIKNNSDKVFQLKNNMAICQIIFFSLTTPVNRPYGSKGLNSHYQNSEGTIMSCKK